MKHRKRASTYGYSTVVPGDWRLATCTNTTHRRPLVSCRHCRIEDRRFIPLLQNSKFPNSDPTMESFLSPPASRPSCPYLVPGTSACLLSKLRCLLQAHLVSARYGTGTWYWYTGTYQVWNHIHTVPGTRYLVSYLLVCMI